MQSIKLYAKLVFLVMFVGIFTIAPVLSSSTKSVVIGNKGVILVPSSTIIAKSGSPTDLQAAVDQVAATGGGTVRIPAGDFVFNPPAGGVGVVVPPGVNLVGAGKGVTILRETVESIGSTMIKLDGMKIPWYTPNLRQVQKPVVVRGISFVGYVPSRADADNEATGTNNVGLSIKCIKDFIVYNCSFADFVNCGISVTNNIGWADSPYLSRGVISHCSFDQPYKDNLAINGRIWGYGIIVQGSGHYLNMDTKTLLGHYDDINYVTYIEDCDFRRCRHAIASTSGAHYVARHNYFTEMIQFHYGSYIDAHGTTQCVEIYDNIIENSPVDYRSNLASSYWGQYLGMGIGLRGGGGVVFNNVIGRCSTDIQLYNDHPGATDRIHDMWVWNNIKENGSSAKIIVWSDTILNQDYFLRRPTLSQDGFTYTPYPYPHPLILEAAP